jgi:squalene-associated FAD-dependent desaturase
MAAAASLAKRGFDVQLLESRPRLGGRASSFEDRVTGETIDNCQHVSMQCCTNFAQLSRELEFDDCFEIERELLFVAPSSPSSVAKTVEPAASAPVKFARFSSSGLPAPLHLAASLWRQSWLTWKDNFRIALAMRKLSRCRVEHDEPFLDWLIRNKQSENARRCFWHVVMVSALSETLDRISLRHAKKVFVDGFLSNRVGWEVAIPKVPLDEIYESRIRVALQQLGVEIRVKAGVEQVNLANGRVSEVRLRSGEVLTADYVISAVPQFSLPGLIPQFAERPEVTTASQLETAPIASVHLWFDREITPLKHAVFVDRLSHWVFNRSKCGSRANDNTQADGDQRQWYYQIVISAARELASMTEAEVLDRVEAELKEVWPASQAAVRLHGRQIIEHKAVFAPTPGVDEKRLGQVTDIPNLFLAGDWTQTGWPATMEGAVRSGYLAAEGVLTANNQTESLLAQPLPESWLYRWLY